MFLCFSGWTCPARQSPRLIWDDSGSGGRKGSLWQVGSLGLLYATDGHEIPSGEVFFDLLPTPMPASHHFVSNPAVNSAQPVTPDRLAKDFAANSQHHPNNAATAAAATQATSPTKK